MWATERVSYYMQSDFNVLLTEQGHLRTRTDSLERAQENKDTMSTWAAERVHVTGL